MYRVNPLFRNVLITTDEVVFHAPTKHTLDPRSIQQNIITAEERLVRTALGNSLYYAITDAKNVVVTDTNKDALQNKINQSQTPDAINVILEIGDIVNSRSFLPEQYLTLWTQHLWKFTAECVMLSSTPEAFMQYGSAGVIHTVPASGPMTTTGEVSPTLSTVKWAMDKKMQDRVDPLAEAMHSWLCQHKTNYPQYNRDCGCDVNGVAYKRKSDLILGLYDEADNKPKNCGCYED